MQIKGGFWVFCAFLDTGPGAHLTNMKIYLPFTSCSGAEQLLCILHGAERSPKWKLLKHGHLVETPSPHCALPNWNITKTWTFTAHPAGTWGFVPSPALSHTRWRGWSQDLAKQKLCLIEQLTQGTDGAEKLMSHTETNGSSAKGK